MDGFSEEDQEQFDSGYEAMVYFMKQGNVRMMPESNGINLSVLPTKAQETKLSEFITRAHGEVILDIDDERGNSVVSVEYPYGTKTSKILNDIKQYFKDGTEPYVSETQAYHYQTRQEFSDILLNNTRSIEIPDGKIRTVVNRLIRSYDLSTDSNKDIYVAVMSLLESNNKTKVNGRGDIHLIFIKSYLVLPS